MQVRQTRRCAFIALVLLAGVGAPRAADAGQNQTQPGPSTPPQRRAEHRLGVEAFGTAGIGWPAASKSFDALALDSKPLEFGGGGRVTGIWRDLFAQVAASRWSDTGERAFVDSAGNRFRLGIPLHVKATYVDVTAGWKSVVRNSRGKITALPYVGAGAGVVMYSESSPFAEPGDDVEKRASSYHVLFGVEFPLLKWLAVAVDGRYRFVPDLLGDAGVSAAFEEDDFGGAQATAGLRVGFGGSPQYRPPARTAPSREAPPEAVTPTARTEAGTGVIVESAPAFLLPDAKRTPLRTLPAGTSVRILEEAGDWIRVEFKDPQFGARVGYVQRRFVQVRKPDAP
jgi:opacity protein-like surface antigen